MLITGPGLKKSLGLDAPLTHGAVDHQQIYGTGAEDLRDWLPLKSRHP